MDKEQYYLNKLRHSCVEICKKHSEYLLTENYLSEFTLEEEKEEARHNLGIDTLLDSISEGKVDINIFNEFVTEVENTLSSLDENKADKTEVEELRNELDNLKDIINNLYKGGDFYIGASNSYIQVLESPAIHYEGSISGAYPITVEPLDIGNTI